jgi:hypothetical protein
VFPAGSVSGHLEESSATIYHGEVVKRLTTASTAHAAWVKQGRNGNWLEVMTAATKLDPQYLERHGGAIRAGWKGFQP